MTDRPTQKLRPRVLSGMRPTGKLHLGNYVGALQNWVKLQNSHDCFFFVADWHALTTDYDNTSRLADNSLEVVLDFLAAGLDPEKCAIFVQSHVKEHAELHLLFSMITPLGWLERVPSFKEQQQQMPNKDLHMYGFLGYPLLQAADILIYRPDFVPVGEDQSAHIELTREVARRFNQFYKLNDKPVFPEPQTLLTPSPKLLGTDKRKMSKSYGNSILLSDEAAAVEQKIKNSVTDRPKLTDRGSPDRCPVGNLHQIFSDPERLTYITEGCTQATITCVECKALAVESVNAHLAPIRERRHALAQNPAQLQETIRHGAEKAIAAAEETMSAVRDAIGLLRVGAVEGLAAKEEATSAIRVPSAAATASTDKDRREIITKAWAEQVSKSYPLRRDRPDTFITRKGRKVGVHTAEQHESGLWEFSFQERSFNVLVLLAEDSEGFLRDYVLPPKIVQDHWKQFEREQSDRGAIIRIKLRQDTNGASILLEQSNLPIQQYLTDYRALQ
ncbi:MAG TPA: tryptophan--tRNA ligase [Candidatus Angelobacter sp.]|nr:tryptophan--tRNA ligase [Candidatus Angelobacter sp.]